MSRNSKKQSETGRKHSESVLPSLWNLPKSELSAVSAFARSCIARTLPMDSILPLAGMVGARYAEVKESILQWDIL